MKKVKMILFLVLMISFIMSTLAQPIDEGIAGRIACNELGKKEYSDRDQVICSYFSYSNPGFQCPEGGTRVCYGCECEFESGAVIRSEVCECHF